MFATNSNTQDFAGMAIWGSHVEKALNQTATQFEYSIEQIRIFMRMCSASFLLISACINDCGLWCVSRFCRSLIQPQSWMHADIGGCTKGCWFNALIGYFVVVSLGKTLNANFPFRSTSLPVAVSKFDWRLKPQLVVSCVGVVDISRMLGSYERRSGSERRWVGLLLFHLKVARL